MLGKFKVNAILVSLLSILFFMFFEISKHNHVLSSVNAFAEDPYDGIGSMGIQAALLLAGLSLLRAFWSYTTEVSENRKVLFARAEMMALLAIGITLASDIVAMLRHPSMWMGTTGGRLLVMLLVVLFLLTAVAGSRAHHSITGISLPKMSNVRSRATVVSFVALFILAFYPENLRHSMPGALCTALIGGVLLFVLMWALGTALVPYCGEADCNDPVTMGWSYLRRYQWIVILLLGAFIGFSLAMRELWKPGGWPHLTGQIAFVVSVYIGLETAGLLIGYALLRKSLGLFGNS